MRSFLFLFITIEFNNTISTSLMLGGKYVIKEFIYRILLGRFIVLNLKGRDGNIVNKLFILKGRI